MIIIVIASQLSLLTTRYMPAKKARDIVARATPRSGNAALSAISTKWMSPSWAQMRVTATKMELNIAIVLQKIKPCQPMKNTVAQHSGHALIFTRGN